MDLKLTSIISAPTRLIAPRLVPSQFYSSEGLPPLYDRSEMDVARILPFPPHLSVATVEDTITRTLSFFDNSLMVYPLSVERFQHRNLGIRFQLVLFDDDVDLDLDPAALSHAPYTVVNNLYSQSTSRGVFCGEVYSKVTYHSLTPIFNDEIKVRIPTDLTRNYALRVSAFHVHVQAKPHGRCTLEIGSAFLRLVTTEGALIEDKEHILQLTPTQEALQDARNKASILNRDAALPAPILRLRTRALSSMYSSCPRIHSFLTTLLGYPHAPTDAHVRVGTVPSEMTLHTVTYDLHKAVESEVTKHFLIIFRQLVSVLTGGSRVMSNDFMNPYNHPLSRCTAFIAMLHCFSKVAPASAVETDEDAEDSDERSVGEEFLRNYIDFIFEDSDLSLRSSVDMSSSLAPLKYANEGAVALFVSLQLEEVLLEDLLLSTVESAVVSAGDFSSMVRLQTGVCWRDETADTTHSCDFHGDKTWIELINSEGRQASELSDAMRRLRATVCSPSVLASEKVIDLNPILPLYEELSGYESRQRESTELRASGGNLHIHWQPWLYEVITAQWCAVLTTLHRNSNTNFSSSTSAPQLPPPSPLHMSSLPYPLPCEQRLMELAADPSKDVRTLLLSHGPLVFKLILKSLSLRITHERKRTPVILDGCYLESIESLVQLLSTEVYNCLTSGSWRGGKLNSALAQFLRSLFALIAPAQVRRLVLAYFARPASRREEGARFLLYIQAL